MSHDPCKVMKKDILLIALPKNTKIDKSFLFAYSDLADQKWVKEVFQLNI